jgi:hypothetical protein
VGNKQWVDVLPWPGAGKWAAAEEVPWEVEGKAAGTVRALGPLSFVKVSLAGHMVGVLCCSCAVMCCVLLLSKSASLSASPTACPSPASLSPLPVLSCHTL